MFFTVEFLSAHLLRQTLNSWYFRAFHAGSIAYLHTTEFTLMVSAYEWTVRASHSETKLKVCFQTEASQNSSEPLPIETFLAAFSIVQQRLGLLIWSS